MEKLYDKILLVVALLILGGGCAVYFMGSTPSVTGASGTGDKTFTPVAAPSAESVTVEWGDPDTQPSGFIYDVFTPYEIYLDRDGSFTQKKPDRLTIQGPEFGSPYLVKIEQELYRIQLEGYIEEDPTDPTKVLILFLNAETGMSVRGRIGQEKADAEFSVVDFQIVRENEGGAIIKTAQATILDKRTGKEVVLTDAERRFNDEVSVVIGCEFDPELMFEFTEAGASFQTSTGNYVLKEINLEENMVTVEKLGDEVNEPITEQLRVETPETTNNTSTPESDTSSPLNNSVFDAIF